MAEGPDIREQLSDAEDSTKLVILQEIERLAKSVSNTTNIDNLAHAYALVVGAKWGQLPGDLSAK